MANLTFNYNKGGVNMYLPRLIEKTIKEKLSYIGAIQIEGPKWCGKSTTASRFADTIIKLQDPIVYTRYKTFATTSKADLLFGNKPICKLHDIIHVDCQYMFEAVYITFENGYFFVMTNYRYMIKPLKL